MSGIEAAAAAVRGALPVRGVFPAIGYVSQCRSYRDAGGLAGFNGLLVRVNGAVEECLWSGALLAEMRAAGADGSALIGRAVKVESIGGELVVAYTINGS